MFVKKARQNDLTQVSQSTHGILRKLLHDFDLEKCSRYLPGYPCAFSKAISHNILRILLVLDCETWAKTPFGAAYPSDPTQLVAVRKILCSLIPSRCPELEEDEAQALPLGTLWPDTMTNVHHVAIFNLW